MTDIKLAKGIDYTIEVKYVGEGFIDQLLATAWRWTVYIGPAIISNRIGSGFTSTERSAHLKAEDFCLKYAKSTRIFTV